MAGIFPHIIEKGNVGHHHDPLAVRQITCRDGFTMKVAAGQGVYCAPVVETCDHETCRVEGGPFSEDCDYPGPYTRVMVTELSERPKTFSAWEAHLNDYSHLAGPKSLYYNVPEKVVQELIDQHGGEIG